jgi:hypothetical protein
MWTWAVLIRNENKLLQQEQKARRNGNATATVANNKLYSARVTSLYSLPNKSNGYTAAAAPAYLIFFLYCLFSFRQSRSLQLISLVVAADSFHISQFTTRSKHREYNKLFFGFFTELPMLCSLENSS